MKRLLLCLTAVLGLATAGSAAQAQLASRDLNYGEIIPIAPATRLVVGRSRDMRTNQSDVANVVMHKAGSTLVVIDTGATPGFRQYLDKAAAQLRPFDSAVLLITHGHSDHTGNNGWIDTLGVPAKAYMSAHDVEKMLHQVDALAPLAQSVGALLPGAPPARDMVERVVAQFGPLDLQTRSLTMLESLPSERIDIGGTSWNGWRLLNGELVVLKTLGHTNGHLAAYLPGVRHLHLADETTSYYQAFAGGHPELNLLTLERSTRAIQAGAVSTMSDGHTLRLFRGEEASTYLDALVNASLAFDAAAVRTLREHPEGQTMNEWIATMAKAPEMRDAPASANGMELMTVMLLANKLTELGIAVPSTPQERIRLRH